MLSYNCLFAHLWQSKATMLLSKAKGQFASISFYYLITICCHLQHYNKSLDYLIFIFTSQMLNVGLARLRLRTLGCHLRIERQKSKNFWDLYWSQDIRHPTSHHTSSNIIYCNMCNKCPTTTNEDCRRIWNHNRPHRWKVSEICFLTFLH